jgi:hypothetical protein
MQTAGKISKIQRDLAELKHRVHNHEVELTAIELPFNEEVCQNGKNETERKAMLARLCMDSDTWQRVRIETDDAIFHRDMVQAELDGLYTRLSAQRAVAALITATLNASIE